MDVDAEDCGWEDIYHLYGVRIEIPDAQPSQGEMGRSPTPLTVFYGFEIGPSVPRTEAVAYL